MNRPSAFTWAEERYAAGERLAKAGEDMRKTLERLGSNPDLFFVADRPGNVVGRWKNALAEYERTRDHP